MSEHYRSEIHQRILLLIILQIISMNIKPNNELVQFNTHLEQEKMDVVYDNMTATTTASTTTANFVPDENEIQQGYIQDTIDTLIGGIETLNDELQQLNNESLQKSQLVESIEQNVSMLKISCEETHAAFDALKTNMTILQQDCTSLKQKIEDAQFTSYDGTIVWKITNVQEKMSKFIIVFQLKNYQKHISDSHKITKKEKNILFFILDRFVNLIIQ